jgi:hypothetical protein
MKSRINISKSTTQTFLALGGFYFLLILRDETAPRHFTIKLFVKSFKDTLSAAVT